MGKHVWRPYAEAKAFVQTLALKNQREWQRYGRSGLRPVDIPSNPSQVYARNLKGWGYGWAKEHAQPGTESSFPLSRHEPLSGLSTSKMQRNGTPTANQRNAPPPSPLTHKRSTKRNFRDLEIG